MKVPHKAHRLVGAAARNLSPLGRIRSRARAAVLSSARSTRDGAAVSRTSACRESARARQAQRVSLRRSSIAGRCERTAAIARVGATVVLSEGADSGSRRGGWNIGEAQG